MDPAQLLQVPKQHLNCAVLTQVLTLRCAAPSCALVPCAVICCRADQLLQLAKQRLESFAYVGATSKLQQSVEELVSALGMSFSQEAHPFTEVSGCASARWRHSCLHALRSFCQPCAHPRVKQHAVARAVALSRCWIRRMLFSQQAQSSTEASCTLCFCKSLAMHARTVFSLVRLQCVVARQHVLL
jgi:hypothetical protein